MGLLLLVMVPGIARADEAHSPARWSDMTVFLADGTILREATVAWTMDGRNLRLTRADGAARVVPFGEVEKIVDRGGRERREEIWAAGEKELQSKGFFNPEIGDTRPALPGRTLADHTADVWLFGWAFSAGVAMAATHGGSFPETEVVFPWTSTLRRRIWRTWYLGLATTSEVHLARQRLEEMPDVPGYVSQVDWTERQMLLTGGVYGESNRRYLEAGIAAIERLGYIKPGLRLQGGILAPLHKLFAVDASLYLLIKPGFKDANGGLAVETGVKVELVAW
jgi:hypothetical protein